MVYGKVAQRMILAETLASLRRWTQTGSRLDLIDAEARLEHIGAIRGGMRLIGEAVPLWIDLIQSGQFDAMETA